MSTIESVSHESRMFEPPPAFAAQANVDKAAYDRLNAAAAADYPGFWAKLAREELLWHKPFSRVLDESHAPFYKWFEDGELNASYNCLERNLQNGNADKTAIRPARARSCAACCARSPRARRSRRTFRRSRIRRYWSNSSRCSRSRLGPATERREANPTLSAGRSPRMTVVSPAFRRA